MYGNLNLHVLTLKKKVLIKALIRWNRENLRNIRAYVRRTSWLEKWEISIMTTRSFSLLGPEHTGHFVQPHVAAHCGGGIYSRRKPLFSSFGEHTAVYGSSVRQAVARPRHRQSVCIHNIHVAATCRPSVLGSATMRGHVWLNKVASVLGPLWSKLW